MAMKIGTIIDKILKLEADADEIKAKALPFTKKANKLREQLLENFTKEDISGAHGKIGVASLVTLEFLEVSDYKKLQTYIKKNNAMDLLQTRLNKTAFKDRLEERKGRPIPGIKQNSRVTLRIGKKRGTK